MMARPHLQGEDDGSGDSTCAAIRNAVERAARGSFHSGERVGYIRGTLWGIVCGACWGVAAGIALTLATQYLLRHGHLGWLL